ncbi:MAG: hypothetical protein P4L46_25555 [Fimbriimonas sp.]|nr:hypothetical protein [Fimbriimonas sp.]
MHIEFPLTLSTIVLGALLIVSSLWQRRVRRNESQGNLGQDLKRATLLAISGFVRSTSGMLLLSCIVLLCAIWIAQFIGTSSGQLAGAINQLHALRERIEPLDDRVEKLSLGLIVLAGLVLVPLSSRGRLRLAYRRSTERQVEEINEALKEGRLPPLDPSLEMQRVMGAAISQHDEIIRAGGSPDQVRAKADELERKVREHLYVLDVKRRLKSEITDADFGLDRSKSTKWDKLLALLLSKPIHESMSRFGKVCYVISLLIMPALFLGISEPAVASAEVDARRAALTSIEAEAKERKSIAASERLPAAPLTDQEKNAISLHALRAENQFVRYVGRQVHLKSDVYEAGARAVAQSAVLHNFVEGFARHAAAEPYPPQYPHDEWTDPGSPPPPDSPKWDNPTAKADPNWDEKFRVRLTSDPAPTGPQTQEFKRFADDLKDFASQSAANHQAVMHEVGRPFHEEISPTDPYFDLLKEAVMDFVEANLKPPLSEILKGAEFDEVKDWLRFKFEAWQEADFERIMNRKKGRSTYEGDLPGFDFVGTVPPAYTEAHDPFADKSLMTVASLVSQDAQALADDPGYNAPDPSRPPSLRELPDPAVDLNLAATELQAITTQDSGARTALKSLEDSPTTASDALLTYTDMYPGRLSQEKETSRSKLYASLTGSEGLSNDNLKANFAKSRDPHAVSSDSRTGGIVFGDPNSSVHMPIRDLTWHAADNGYVVFDFQLANGQTVSTAPIEPTLAFCALGYAADGRPLATTIINVQPVQYQRVISHPALIDSPIGKDLIDFDQYTFDAIKQQNGSLQQFADNTSALLELYRLVQELLTVDYKHIQCTMVVQGLLVQQGGKEPGSFSDEATKFLHNEPTIRSELRAAIVGVLAKRPAVLSPSWLAQSPLHTQDTVYDQDVVKMMGDSDTGSSDRTADRLEAGASGIIGTDQPRTNEDYKALVDRVKSLTQPGGYGMYSIVRDLDQPDIAAILADSSGHSIEKILAFSLQTKTERLLASGQNVAEFSDKSSELTGVVDRYIQSDPTRMEVAERVSQFAGLQQIFRAAFLGNLDSTFPVKRLISLSQWLAQEPLNSLVTARWLRPAQATIPDIQSRLSAALGMTKPEYVAVEAN